jgi:capsular exopolysaccharide synthesis family protein
MQNDSWSEEEVPQQQISIFKKLLGQFLLLWPWLILSTVICLSLAYLYSRYSAPQYRIRASILIKDDKSGAGEDDGTLQSFGLSIAKSNVDNEVEIFKSRALMQTVVEKQQLFVKYFINRRMAAPTEVFLNTPVTFQYTDRKATEIAGSASYVLTFDKKNVTKFTLVYNDKSYFGKLGDTLTISGASILISATPQFAKWQINQELIITVSPFDGAVREYMGRLGLLIPNKQASILYLSIVEAVPQKGEAVLDALINIYLQASVEDKKLIADSTIKFIDDRLRLVFTELSGIEKEMQGYKTINKFTNIEEQSSLLLTNTGEYSRQLTEQEIQLSVVEALENFLKENQYNDRIVPASLMVQEANFTGLIGRYNEMQLQRDKMLMSIKPEHPSIITINEQLRNIKLEIVSSLGSIKNGIKVTIAELKKRANGVDAQMSRVPEKQRVWLDYTRQQSIKQELYLFLLKKREETAISQSSKLANARVIDLSKSDAYPFAPQRRNFMMIGLLLGIAIPYGIYLLKELFNNKVSSLDDIVQVTNAPILAEIGHNPLDNDVVVEYASRSLISEQFRALRTNIRFLLAGENEKVILVTSSMSGEGKSFVSINLAAALSLAGKKVILLELDLRKPKISDSLKLQKLGITNYLVEQDQTWQQWVQSFGKENKFDVLSSGPLPPNPAELLMLPKLSSLISELRSHYEYVIIDSAPIGLVTDAQILAASADATLYLVRHGLTFKQQLHFIDKLHRKRTLPKMNIIINDIQVKKMDYGYEGYGYGYGYGYGSYGEETKKS